MFEGISIEEFYLLYKVGEVANSETAQRLIDVAISKLEEKESK